MFHMVHISHEGQWEFYLPAPLNLPNNWDLIITFIKGMLSGPCRKKCLFSIENCQVFINPKPSVLQISDSRSISLKQRGRRKNTTSPWNHFVLYWTNPKAMRCVSPFTLRHHFRFMYLCPWVQFGAGLGGGSGCQRKHTFYFIFTQISSSTFITGLWAP